jgi:hypothetical protein
MNSIKKYWFLATMILLLGYCTNELVQSNIRDANKERIRKEVKLQIEKNLVEAIRINGANYKWIKKFQYSPVSGKLFSSDLEGEWISKGPIFFPGYIKDISNLDEENYQLKFNYLKLDYIIPKTSLNLICKKSMVDAYLLQNPGARDALPDENKGAALIADISSISADSEGHLVGNGRCIQLLKDVGLESYELINLD